jgi:hypothetical protein
MKVTTETTTTLATSIKRLALSKDQKRVLLALADAGDWTLLDAVMTLLGRSQASLKRTRDTMIALVEEKLIEGGIREDDKVGVFRVRGAGIRWGY